ncbi:hypothetical protein ACFWZ3_15675 [Frateuria sp. GZRR35]|uniref:hypothetical protein n=1 Tax=Frateuria sp. GZRR35 TaxID=3351536 RepID=UPI003EDC1770
MRFTASIVLAAFVTSQSFAQELARDQAKLVQQATTVSLRALQFTQGDLASLLDAKSQFTPGGWAEFMKKLDGWQDETGAATFSSRFVPSGPALDVRRHDGVVDLTIPGVLEQENRNPYGGVSTTKYRAEIDLRLAEALGKITHLKQRTCGSAGSHPSCR